MKDREAGMKRRTLTLEERARKGANQFFRSFVRFTEAEMTTAKMGYFHGFIAADRAARRKASGRKA